MPTLATRTRHRTVTGYVVIGPIGGLLSMDRLGFLVPGKVAHLFTSSGRAWAAVARSRTNNREVFDVVPVGRHP